MDDRDELLKQYLSTKYLTAPPEEVSPAQQTPAVTPTPDSVTTTADDNTEGPETESTPGNAQAESHKDPYAVAADDSGVKDAQAGRNRAELISNVGRSLSHMFTARAQANGYKPDDSVYDNIAKSGQTGVDEAQAARQNAIKDYLAKRQMGRQDTQDQYSANAETRAQGEYDRQPVQAQQKMDFQKAELAARLAEQHGEHELANKYRQDSLAQQAVIHQDNLSAQAENRQAQRDMVTGTRQGAAYQKASKDLETFRGNSAVQQANINILSAKNALQLVKGKDPNSLTTQDLSLLSGEMAKIATGGVPTEHGQQALMPHNLATKAAEFSNFLSSSPTPAQAGEYVQKNMKYLEEMQAVAEGTVKDFRRNTLNGYKHQLTPEDYQDLESRHGLGAQQPQAPGGQSPGGTPPPAKTETSRKYSPSRKLTRVTFSDGSVQDIPDDQ